MIGIFAYIFARATTLDLPQTTLTKPRTTDLFLATSNTTRSAIGDAVLDACTNTTTGKKPIVALTFTVFAIAICSALLTTLAAVGWVGYRIFTRSIAIFLSGRALTFTVVAALVGAANLTASSAVFTSVLCVDARTTTIFFAHFTSTLALQALESFCLVAGVVAISAVLGIVSDIDASVAAVLLSRIATASSFDALLPCKADFATFTAVVCIFSQVCTRTAALGGSLWLFVALKVREPVAARTNLTPPRQGAITALFVVDQTIAVVILPVANLGFSIFAGITNKSGTRRDVDAEAVFYVLNEAVRVFLIAGRQAGFF